ncbi:MAG: hypothetical protein IJ890_08275 [Clostridia bacterium]|nr:hypothetical protein [Clostridia bacterium]
MREGLAYGYGCQLIPSEDISEVCTGMKKLKRSEYTSQYDNILWRPLVADDNSENVVAAFDVTNSAYKNDSVVIAGIDNVIEPTNANYGDGDFYLFEFADENANNAFNFINWYLIPIDENDNQILEIGNEFDTSVTAAATIEYWFDNTQLACGGAPISRGEFNGFVACARAFGFDAFTIKYNESDSEPVYYSFVNSGIGTDSTRIGGAVQIIHPADLPNVVDLEAIALEQAYGDPEEAKYYYDYFTSEQYQSLYYWTLAQFDSEETEGNVFYQESPIDHHRGYYMVPLDSDGNEVLKLMVS